MPRKETPRESTIVKQIVTALRARPYCIVFKYHGGPYAVAGHPDLYGCDNGRAFAFEVKRQESARHLFNSVASGSGKLPEPSLESSPAQQTPSSTSKAPEPTPNQESTSTTLRSWPPLPRYLAASLERRGMSRADAVAMIREVYTESMGASLDRGGCRHCGGGE